MRLIRTLKRAGKARVPGKSPLPGTRMKPLGSSIATLSTEPHTTSRDQDQGPQGHVHHCRRFGDARASRGVDSIISVASRNNLACDLRRVRVYQVRHVGIGDEAYSCRQGVRLRSGIVEEHATQPNGLSCCKRVAQSRCWIEKIARDQCGSRRNQCCDR